MDILSENAVQFLTWYAKLHSNQNLLRFMAICHCLVSVTSLLKIYLRNVWYFKKMQTFLLLFTA